MTAFTGTIPTVASGDTTTVPTNLAIYRDALKAASEAWTAYTPTWTGSGGNPALGNGSFAGSAYARVNKLIHFRIVLTMGSTTTYGTGGWSLTLPVAPLSVTKQTFVAQLSDTGAADYTAAGRMSATGSKLDMVCPGTSAGGADRTVQSNQPFTWGSTDTLVVVGTYEAA